jgi:hypothetical protein
VLPEKGAFSREVPQRRESIFGAIAYVLAFARMSSANTSARSVPGGQA